MRSAPMVQATFGGARPASVEVDGGVEMDDGRRAIYPLRTLKPNPPLA